MNNRDPVSGGYSYFFLLSGELVDLGSGELRSLIQTYDPAARITNRLQERLVLVDGEPDLQRIMSRAAFTKVAGRALYFSEDDRLLSGFDLDGGAVRRGEHEAFACKLVNLSGTPPPRDLLGELGRHVKESAPWLRVSFEAPDLTFVAVITDAGLMVGLNECGNRSRREAGESRTRDRAYFHPVALKPKLCRAMINLATVREDSTILDPFCGTGGIMLEALRMKINAIGCDLAPKMCKGALANLRGCGGSGSLVANGDACSLPFRMDGIDAVVTDLPYGRAASTLTRNPGALLKDFLEALGELKHGRCCVMCRKEEGDEQKKFTGIAVAEEYDVYEHRSLTRKLMVICN